MATIVKKARTPIIIGSSKKGIYRPMIRSRHPSHAPLRQAMEKLPFRSVIRMGSLTELTDEASKLGTRVELNSAEAIKNSSSKLKMKQCFTRDGVKTADWFTSNNNSKTSFLLNGTTEQILIENLSYPIVAKSHFGSKGKGNTLIKSQNEFERWMDGKVLTNYIFEKYCNFNKEYRLHVTKNGCFYTCRKMLRQEFKDHPNSWQRHDDNCVWILEENENFDKPVNWKEIVEHCVKAVISCGLDFGACDLRVQNNVDGEGKKRHACDFIVVEINSAPSFGAVTLEKYKTELKNLLIEKHNV